jgi:hypothetical protein
MAMGAGLWAAETAAAPETSHWNAPAVGESPTPDGRPADGGEKVDEPVAEAPYYAAVVITDYAGKTRRRIVGLADTKVTPPPEFLPIIDKEMAAYNEAVKDWNEKKKAFAADSVNQYKRFPEPFPSKPAVRMEGGPVRTLAEARAILDKSRPGPSGRSDPGKTPRQHILQDRLMDHFFWGTCAPAEWINETRQRNGARWDVACGYLSGGAAKPDVWWIKYGGANNMLAGAGRNGGVCWFTWYMLAQSNPADYKPGPAQATPVNARVAETMRSYFGLFKELMLICAKHADVPVVVQIEPDEWGHLLLSAGMDPARVDVKVGASGLEELKGLPDNLFGYAAAFDRLRSRYAPQNVLLGCNPSGWDWRGSMTGAKFGALLKLVCANYELAVFETGDRDKGMHGKAPPYGNQSGICETFDNHIRWIEEFHAASGLPVVVWQVAMGNTVFAACNNTPGHFCDNLAQTLLEDYPRNPMISRYAAAGCIGWLFQGGQGDSTASWDARKDGITNPDAIPGNLGKKSEYPDDDGGYIRLRVGEYYKNPYPLLGKPAPKPPPPPAPARGGSA